MATLRTQRKVGKEVSYKSFSNIILSLFIEIRTTGESNLAEHRAALRNHLMVNRIQTMAYLKFSTKGSLPNETSPYIC